MNYPDPTSAGSGNPGATNVVRIGGKGAGAFVLLMDIAKVFIPIVIARWLTGDELIALCVGVGAFAGHVFPPLRVGGKGVASFLGCLLGFYPPGALVFVIVWLGMFAVSRYSSVAGMTASGISPIALWALDAPIVVTATTALMALLVIGRHRANIRQLLGD